MRRRRNPIGIGAQKDIIHVKRQNLVFGKRLFHPVGEDDLADLALDLAAAIKQKVLHDLLGNGRSAAHIFPARAHSLDQSGQHPAGIKALMLVKILVLGADEGPFHDIGNFIGGREDAAFPHEFIKNAPIG